MKIAHGTLVMAADGQKALLLRNEGDEKYAVLPSGEATSVVLKRPVPSAGNCCGRFRLT